MSEVVRYIPESVVQAKPKEGQNAYTPAEANAAMARFWNRGRNVRRQTLADLERSAAFRAEIHEAVEQYWTNMAKSEAEGAHRIPWWALLLAFLGAILSDGADPQDTEDVQ
jgi:hypothetical protein